MTKNKQTECLNKEIESLSKEAERYNQMAFLEQRNRKTKIKSSLETKKMSRAQGLVEL